MRKTKKVRLQFDLTLHYPELLDSIPVAVGTPRDYMLVIEKVLQKSLRQHKDKRTLLTSPLRMNIQLDFRK